MCFLLFVGSFQFLVFLALCSWTSLYKGYKWTFARERGCMVLFKNYNHPYQITRIPTSHLVKWVQEFKWNMGIFQQNYFFFHFEKCSVQFSSVAQSCPTLCDPMNHSTPGLPVHHQLPEFTQTHVHRVSDTIQPSHPLLLPSLPAFNISQHQRLFQMSQLFASGGQSIGVLASASVLPMNTQDWYPLGWTGWMSL